MIRRKWTPCLRAVPAGCDSLKRRPDFLCRFDQGLQFLQGTYPCDIISSLVPVYSCLCVTFICFTLLQSGKWNFMVLVFNI